MSENRLARWCGRYVGIVFQFFQLLPTLTAQENIELALEDPRLGRPTPHVCAYYWVSFYCDAPTPPPAPASQPPSNQPWSPSGGGGSSGSGSRRGGAPPPPRPPGSKPWAVLPARA